MWHRRIRRTKDCVDILIEGLKRLEYRGYDSAGHRRPMNGDDRHREGGRQDHGAREDRSTASRPTGTLGIAHTRWATHGEPNTCNAHPHTDCTGPDRRGPQRDHRELRRAQEARSRTRAQFTTETDTEVLAHLIEKYMHGGRLDEAVSAALQQVEGTYGIAVVSADEPGKIVGARHGSPLVIGVGDGEYFVASDVAPSSRTRSRSSTSTTARWRCSPPTATAPRRSRARRSTSRSKSIAWDLEQIEKGGFDALHAQGDLRAAASRCATRCAAACCPTRARRSWAAST